MSRIAHEGVHSLITINNPIYNKELGGFQEYQKNCYNFFSPNTLGKNLFVDPFQLKVFDVVIFRRIV